MMRIATPESVWPGHFINRLNKMQNSYRAYQSNEESKNSYRLPRGSGCSRGSKRFHNKGAGIKRGGCRIPPFWMSNQQYCNAANSKESNSKRCRRDQTFGEVLKATEEAVRAALESTHLNSKDSKESDSKKESVNPSEVPRSPINDILNVGEVMKSTEEAVRAALESNNLDSKDSDSKKDSSRTPNKSASTNAMNDLNNFGEVMMGVLSSLGIELDAEMKNSKDSENKENPEGPNKATQEQGKNSEMSEAGANRIYPTLDENSGEQEKDSEMRETGTKPKTRSIPIIEENHQNDENSFEVLSNPETDSTQKKDEPEAMEETVMPLSPKIKVALQAMENMGFNNDNNWLSDLLMKYDGDIGKVLDLIRANQIRSN